MAKLTRNFIVAMVGIFSIIGFTASTASATEKSCDPASQSITAPTFDDPGVFVPPDEVHVNAASTQMEGHWRLDDGPWVPLTAIAADGGWDFPVPLVDHAGTLHLEVNGSYPAVIGYCHLQVLPPITTPVVKVVWKKGKPFVQAAFGKNRPVTSTLTVRQKVKKRGKGAKMVKKSSATSVRVRPGKLTANLVITAEGHVLHDQTYRLKAKKKKKKHKK